MASRPAPPRPFNPALAAEVAEAEAAPARPGIAQAVPAAESPWRDMASCPVNRPVFLTGDRASDPEGLLCYWRVTRTKNRACRGWSTAQYWAFVLNRRAIAFEPAGWREASGGAALAAAIEAERDAGAA